MLTRKLLGVIDNIIVDVFKIICCSEPTDSFMVNVTVAQLPGHSRAQGFTAGARAPAAPPLGAATAGGSVWLRRKYPLRDGFRRIFLEGGFVLEGARGLTAIICNNVSTAIQYESRYSFVIKSQKYGGLTDICDFA